MHPESSAPQPVVFGPWRDAVNDPPLVPGFYFCHHEKWGRVVMGWSDGWGTYPPRKWLDNDQLNHEMPSPDCQKLLRDGNTVGVRATA